MQNELEKKRKQRESKKRPPVIDPLAELQALMLTMGPQLLEDAQAELEEEIIQAEREQQRRRRRMKHLLELGRVVTALVDMRTKPPSPSA